MRRTRNPGMRYLSGVSCGLLFVPFVSAKLGKRREKQKGPTTSVSLRQLERPFRKQRRVFHHCILRVSFEARLNKGFGSEAEGTHSPSTSERHTHMHMHMHTLDSKNISGRLHAIIEAETQQPALTTSLAHQHQQF